MKIIHLIRDARAVSNSYRKNNNFSLTRGAIYWRRINKLILDNTKKYNCDVLKVKYEDLCISTQDTLNDIYAFCGIDKEHDIVMSLTSQHLIGNRMRLKKNVAIKIDESWKQELSSEEIYGIEKICGFLNWKFGYERL
jgi:hypothetical protein